MWDAGVTPLPQPERHATAGGALNNGNRETMDPAAAAQSLKFMPQFFTQKISTFFHFK